MGNATIASAGMGANIFGGLFSAFGKSKEGAAQQQMYNYQSGVALTNKKIAEQNMTYALDAGETSAVKYGIGAKQQMGQIIANQGASGIDVGMGSTVDVQRGQQQKAGIDLNQIRANAARVAYGFETQAVQDEAQSKLYTMAGENAKTAGNINAVGSLVSTAGSVSDKWLQAQQYGLYSGNDPMVS